MNKKIIMIALAVLAIAVIAVIAFAAVAACTDMTKEAEVQATAVPMDEPDMANEGEATIEIFELSGSITEILDGAIVIHDRTHGQVQVNLGDDTLYDGADFDELVVGQFVQVMYDGKMTRSLPAQVYALKVGVYPLSGVVKERGEDRTTIDREEIGDEVIVFLPEDAPQLAVGDSVTVYTSGVMTMSIPAQTTAIGIVLN